MKLNNRSFMRKYLPSCPETSPEPMPVNLDKTGVNALEVVAHLAK